MTFKIFELLNVYYYFLVLSRSFNQIIELSMSHNQKITELQTNLDDFKKSPKILRRFFVGKNRI